MLIILTLFFVASFWLSCSSMEELKFEKIERYPSGVKFRVSSFDGDVIVFYRQGQYILVKQCEDFSEVKKIEDCKMKDNTFVRQVSISDFIKSLSRALKFIQLPSYQMREEVMKIFKAGVKEDFQRKLKRLYNFLNETYGTKENEINSRLLVLLGELEKKIKVENLNINEINKIVHRINIEINTVVNNFIDDKKIHKYNYNKVKISFVFNVLAAFLRTSSLEDADFSKIEEGEMTLGSRIGEKYRMNDENQVSIKIKASFEMMKTEVSQIQWFLVMGSNPSFFKKEKYCDDHLILYGEELCPNNPVEQVSRDDIDIFIKKLNQSSTEKQVKLYDLPTSGEWEYSVRAGTATSYFFGDNPIPLGRHAWYMKNSKKQTHKAGHKKKGPKYNLYDVYGNVWEILKNQYTVDKENNSNLNLDKRSLYHKRGGSWIDSDVSYFRSAYQSYQSYQETSFNTGFRLLRYKGRRDEISEVIPQIKPVE